MNTLFDDATRRASLLTAKARIRETFPLYERHGFRIIGEIKHGSSDSGGPASANLQRRKPREGIR